jgi:hypothetical protein
MRHHPAIHNHRREYGGEMPQNAAEVDRRPSGLPFSWAQSWPLP